MNKRDWIALGEKLEDSEFARGYSELWSLRHRRGVRVTRAPITPDDLKEGKSPRIFTWSTPDIPIEVATKRASKLYEEVLLRATQLSASFPESKRWRWREIFIDIALGGRGDIEGERGGGPPPTPKEERIRIVKGWEDKKGLVLQEVYAANCGIDASTLRRWRRELREEGLL